MQLSIAIFGDSLTKARNTRYLNANLIRLNAIDKCFSDATSKDSIHYMKPALIESIILHIGVNDSLKHGSNVVISKNILNIFKECKNYRIIRNLRSYA